MRQDSLFSKSWYCNIYQVKLISLLYILRRIVVGVALGYALPAFCGYGLPTHMQVQQPKYP